MKTANNIDSENNFGAEDLDNSLPLMEVNYDQLSADKDMEAS